MKIELLHDYYIDVSPKGYTLKKRYISEKRTGEKVTREKGCGYYSDLGGALDAFCRLNQDSEFGNLHTYFGLHRDIFAIPRELASNFYDFHLDARHTFCVLESM